jgi:hypothetical protein
MASRSLVLRMLRLDAIFNCRARPAFKTSPCNQGSFRRFFRSVAMRDEEEGRTPTLRRPPLESGPVCTHRMDEADRL